jgi:hypothetical protein
LLVVGDGSEVIPETAFRTPGLHQAAKQMAVTEVAILRDDHPVFSIRIGSERCIGRPVSLG